MAAGGGGGICIGAWSPVAAARAEAARPAAATSSPGVAKGCTLAPGAASAKGPAAAAAAAITRASTWRAAASSASSRERSSGGVASAAGSDVETLDEAKGTSVAGAASGEVGAVAAKGACGADVDGVGVGVWERRVRTQLSRPRARVSRAPSRTKAGTKPRAPGHEARPGRPTPVQRPPPLHLDLARWGPRPPPRARGPRASAHARAAPARVATHPPARPPARCRRRGSPRRPRA